MREEELAHVRMRAEEAGLHLDDARLDRAAHLMRAFAGMIEELEKIDVEPTDLALETFDPSWSERERTR